MGYCVRCAYRHPASDGAVVLWVQPGEDPAPRFADLLADRDLFRHFPTEGWILTMELQCPHCGETRLIETIGPVIFCSVCGKASPSGAGAPSVTAAGRRG